MNWKAKLHEVIFEADTRTGKLFDVILFIMISISVLVVMLESISPIYAKYKPLFKATEWVLTIFFTTEYILRIIAVNKPWRYIFSFYGLIDLLSTLPKYISLFIPGAYALTTLRALRLLRIFRILKLGRHIGASERLMQALKASRAKIAVFIFAVSILIVLLGTLMYLIEGPKHGFDNIPKSIYWAVVTLTTVGYGDLAPGTAFGQFVASLIMILGYGIIAVPTGIVGAELKNEPVKNTEHCPTCLEDKHIANANYCHRCGARLKQI